ncbi:MAG: AAA family ATPase [Actinomycetota bacterium]
MIPVRLHLTDFLSYRVMEEPLDFTQITLACLSGPNGHGKSALLDAITWSLWGKARGCEGGQEQERLIRDGAEATRVEFVFELDGQTFRVARTRWRTGKGDIAFNIQADDGSWTDLAGEGIADTQRRIIERLRMDYETFVASAFILQGRADTFTRLDPRQRKDVLGKILGLEVYERLAERAKEKRKDVQAETESASAVLATLEADVAERPELERQRTEAQTAHDAATKERAAIDEALGVLRTRSTELHGVEAAAAETAKRLAENRETLKHDEEEIERLGLEAQRLAAEAVIDEATTARAATLETLERDERVMEDARRRFDELSGEDASLRSRIEQERARLETDAASHERTASRLERELAAEPEARALVERARTEIEELERAAAEREALLARHAGIRERSGELAAERAARENETVEIEEKRVLLEETGAGCPLCGQKLTATHRKEVRAGFAARLKEIAASAASASKEQKALDAELRTIEKQGTALKAALDRRETLAAQVAKLDQQLERLTAARSEIQDAIKARDEIAARIKAEDFAAGEREKLARVREELGTVGFDRETYTTLKDALRAAREADRALAKARQAEQALAATTKEAAAAEKRATRVRKALEQAGLDLDGMRRVLEELPSIAEQLERATKERADAQNRFESAATIVARTAHALEVLERKEAEAAAVRVTVAAGKRTAGLYEKLGKAFGRDGIPARIVGNAIPELRIEANRLLGLLSDGQLSISIDPVRETKSRSMKETLEVTVFDAAGGKRPYEMYSGGERLRIDFALRVALSRLLANRAGARLETLVVDEGFGSQDAEGRSRLVEAILRVRSEFRTVLLITHIDELKEHFPVRIEIRKDPDLGSVATVV